jgi:hypothetical protein
MNSAKILAFKNEPFLVDDNTKSEAILSALDLLQFLIITTPNCSTVNRCIKYTKHPTHWLLVIHFCQMSDHADNGFAIRGWPKSQYLSESIVDDAIMTLTSDCPASATSKHRSLLFATYGCAI